MNTDPLGNVFDPPSLSLPAIPGVALLSVGPGAGMTVMWPQGDTQLGKGLISVTLMIYVEGHQADFFWTQQFGRTMMSTRLFVQDGRRMSPSSPVRPLCRVGPNHREHRPCPTVRTFQDHSKASKPEYVVYRFQAITVRTKL